jgi:hypothetical protein
VTNSFSQQPSLEARRPHPQTPPAPSGVSRREFWRVQRSPDVTALHAGVVTLQELEQRKFCRFAFEFRQGPGRHRPIRGKARAQEKWLQYP